MASSNSQIDKTQHGHPKRAELPDVNINTGAQSINTESFFITLSTVSAHLRLPEEEQAGEIICPITKHYKVLQFGGRIVCGWT